jgi:hypothetical protein
MWPVNAYRPYAFVLPKEYVMPKHKQGHSIVLDDKGQEQPADKDRAQKADKTQPGHVPPQPEEDELQPLKDKSGF